MPIDSVSPFQGGGGGSYYVPGGPPPGAKKRKDPFSKDSLESLADGDDPSVKKRNRDIDELQDLQWLAFFSRLLKKRFRFFFTFPKALLGFFQKGMKKPAKQAKIEKASFLSRGMKNVSRVFRTGYQSLSSLSSYLVAKMSEWGVSIYTGIYNRCAPPCIRFQKAFMTQWKRVEAAFKRGFERVKIPTLAFVEKVKAHVERLALVLKRRGEKIANVVAKQWKVATDPIKKWVAEAVVPQMRRISESVSRTFEARLNQIKTVTQQVWQTTVSFAAPFIHRAQSWWSLGQSKAREYFSRFQKAARKVGKWGEEKSQQAYQFILKTFGPSFKRVAFFAAKHIQRLWISLLQFLERMLRVLFEFIFRVMKKSILKIVDTAKKLPSLCQKYVKKMGVFLKNIPIRVLQGLKWVDASLYRLFRKLTHIPNKWNPTSKNGN